MPEYFALEASGGQAGRVVRRVRNPGYGPEFERIAATGRWVLDAGIEAAGLRPVTPADAERLAREETGLSTAVIDADAIPRGYWYRGVPGTFNFYVWGDFSRHFGRAWIADGGHEAWSEELDRGRWQLYPLVTAMARRVTEAKARDWVRRHAGGAVDLFGPSARHPGGRPASQPVHEG